ncbi:MAG: hypothetical protein GDA50_01030 [Alphaproteobacteria bacterium GM202ARS2]|nr:hypothetical protein [Alphaproteobacteria bacterium GM202ARS2]
MIINTVLSGLRMRPSNEAVRVSYHGDIVVGEGSRAAESSAVGGMGARRVRVFAGARDDASRALSGRDFMSISQSRDFIADHCQRYLNATGVQARLQGIANAGPRGERLYRDYQDVLQQITSFNGRGERAITARELSSLTRQVVLVATKSHRFMVASQSSSVSSMAPKDAFYDEMTFDNARGRFALKRKNLLSHSVKRLALHFGVGRRYYARKAAQAFAEAVANKCGHNRLAYGVFRAQGHDMAALLSGDLLDDRGAFRPLSKGEVARAAQMSRSQEEVVRQKTSVHETACALIPGGKWWVDVARHASLSEKQARKMNRAWLQDTIEAELQARYGNSIMALDKDKALQVAASVVSTFARTPTRRLKEAKLLRLQAQRRGRELVSALASGQTARVVHAAKHFDADQQAFAAEDPFYGSSGSEERASSLITSLLMPLRYQYDETYAMQAIDNLQGDVGANWSCALGVLAEDAQGSEKGNRRIKGMDVEKVSSANAMRAEDYRRHHDFIDALEDTLAHRVVANSYRQSERDVRALYAERGRQARAALDDAQVRDDPFGSLIALESHLDSNAAAHIKGEDVVAAVRLYGGLLGNQAREVN